MVSIIVPCYNSGDFLLDAVESCFKSSFQNFEILIVNDGSTDQLTLSHLESLAARDKIRVFHQPNQGVGKARNIAAAHAKGDFFFFLDADNRVRPDYFTEAVDAMRSRPTVGVVYAKPYFFNEQGQAPERFTVRPYSFDALLAGNFIDMCALVRRSAFEKVAGFDESRNLFGWEDWDLWIRIAMADWEFHLIDKVRYDYRVEDSSMMGQINQEQYNIKLAYFSAKHGPVIFSKMKQYYPIIACIRTRPLRLFLVYLFRKYILRTSIV
jgi:glycosyltransferase involved in cell wall biosynthesis